MGAHFLRSSRCRKATGLSIQLTHRNPSGCPLSSLRNMSGERNPHAITSNPARRIDYSSLAGSLRRICSNSDHRLHLGRVDTEKNRKEMAEKSATTAVVAALAPICADKFQHASDAAANLTELKKVSSWQQGSFVEKGGWATLPGSDPANSAVAQACANLLTGLK
jgi:hypothetical protein